MNNRYIITLLLLLTMNCLPDRTWGQAAAPAATAMQQLEVSFETSYLQTAQLESFAKRGKEKARELMELMPYLYESSLDAEFREVILKQMLSLFIDSAQARVQIQTWQAAEIGKTTEALNISQSEQWMEKIAGQYVAGLKLRLSESSPELSLHMRLFRKMKDFGGEQQPVWTVLLEP